jgi:hypothetical protein
MNAEVEIAQLRSRVAQLEAQLTFLYAHLGVTYVPDPDIINQPVIDLLKTGHYMDAMKAYMDIHKASLSNAKAAVDALNQKYGTE